MERLTDRVILHVGDPRRIANEKAAFLGPGFFQPMGPLLSLAEYLAPMAIGARMNASPERSASWRRAEEITPTESSDSRTRIPLTAGYPADLLRASVIFLRRSEVNRECQH